MFVKNSSIEIGSIVKNVNKIETMSGSFKSGSVLKVIGKGERGLDVIDVFGNRSVECGYEFNPVPESFWHLELLSNLKQGDFVRNTDTIEHSFIDIEEGTLLQVEKVDIKNMILTLVTPHSIVISYGGSNLEIDEDSKLEKSESKTPTQIVVGFPCIGKTTLGNTDKLKYMDLEFRETASARGLTVKQKEDLYKNYINIVKLVSNSGYYDILMVTDNSMMVDALIENNLPFTYVAPNMADKDFIEAHKNRVINRDSIEWYNNIIKPRLEILRSELKKVDKYPNAKIGYLDTETPYLSTYLKSIGVLD